MSTKSVLSAVAVLTLFAGCTSLPTVDTTKTDATCARECNAKYSTCIGGFHFFPLQNQWECNDAMKSCVGTCPAPTQAAAIGAIPGALTAEQRLTELDALHKKGLISDAEYQAKKAEILKSM